MGTAKKGLEPEFEVGSGNVFADIGFEDAEEMKAKSDLVIAISNTMQARGLSQTKASEIVGVDQPTLSKLLRGITLSFTIDRLSNMLLALGQDVEINIRPHSGVGERGEMRVSWANRG